MRQILRTLVNNSTFKEAVENNMSRLFYLSLVLIPISIIHIVVFAFFVEPTSVETALWRNGIIIAHILIVIFASVMSFAIFAITNYERDLFKVKILLQLLSIIVVMVLGVVITGVDQYVTTSISPFIIVSIVVALVVLVPPWISFTLYFALFGFFYFVMQHFVAQSTVLTSNILNGVTVTGMAIGLSNILWNYFSKTEKQRRLIEEQNFNLEVQKIELQQLNYRLEQLATRDSMTQLLNRREFENQVNAELELFKEEHFVSSMMIADIDNFKTINDVNGHLFGDELLKQFSQILKTVLRDQDLVARWGGDEFVILLHRVSPVEAYKIAERLRKKIESTNFVVDNLSLTITSSFGIAPLDSTEHEPLYSSYLRADRALYQAKELGRNKTIIDTQESMS